MTGNAQQQKAGPTDVGRRDALRLTGAATIAAAVFSGRAMAQSSGRVVIIGAGFGGASCARELRNIAPGIEITLVERNPLIVTCPFSNTVLGGINEISAVSQSLDGLRAAGIKVLVDTATGIDPGSRTVTLKEAGNLNYDRLVLSPGIDLKWAEIDGYNADVAKVMPHAWKAGAQTDLLRRQLVAMDDGGTVIIAPPINPFRCPPGPYERASLIAHYLKAEKPRSKILILDAKDKFSKQGLFTEGWNALYPGLIEWVPFSQGGGVTSVDPGNMSVRTGFETFSGDVINIIPPQRSNQLVDAAGLAGDGEWCEVDGTTLESKVAPDIHILGDSSVAGDMPKSGFSATSQGLVCAHAISALMAGEAPSQPAFLNTCYSLVGPKYGISVAGVYRTNTDGAIKSVSGAGGTSPMAAADDFRASEADFGRGWYASITTDLYG